MSAASNYTENNVINSLLRGVAFPLPAKTYVSLHTANPGEAGGNEVTVGDFPAYVRREAEQGGAIGTGWSAPSDGVSRNAKQLTYPGFDGAAPVTVTHWAVYDASTGGNMLFYAPLQTSRQLQTGDVFVFDINALTATMS
jgi:hypothetical protein